MKIQHSGGTGTSSCLVHNVMNYQIGKKQKQTNKPAYQLPTTVLFLLQSLLLVKFSFFCVVDLFLGRSDRVWGRWPIGITLFSLHLLFIHFILSYPVYISLSISLDSLLYYLLLHQSSITVHVWESTHLLLFHDALFVIRKASPEGRRPAYSFTVSLGKSQFEVCERRGKSFIKYFKGHFIKMLPRDTPHGNTIYM